MPQLKPTRGIRLNKSHPLARGLVGCWLFNEGSGGQVFDLSGNRNDGSLVSTTWVPGKFGSAINFPGSTDYINIADNPTLDTNKMTICALFNKASIGNSLGGIVSKRVSGSDDAFQLYVDSSNKLQFAIWIGDVNKYTTSISTVSAGQDYFACGVYDGSNVSIYLDGKYENQTAASGTVDITVDPVRIGWTYSDTYSFSGIIDYVMIFNRALTPSEIALLYREPFCMFERAWIPKLIGGQIVELAGSSVALSSLSATAKAMRKVSGNVVSTTDVTAILNLIRSLLYIESNWKREAIFNGMTANAFKLGTTLSLGWFWVRVAGCSVLYRGSSMGEIDFVNILAVAEQDAREISPPSYISHNSGSTYFYVIRRFNDCGYQECTLAASVKVSIESTGELAQPQPNKVFDSGAELVDGNKIQLVWYYCPLEQKSQPMCFNVYYDGRSGQINYENPLAIIGYKGRKFYSYQCGTLEAGRYLFAIRTEDASGVENSSLARLRIQFDSINPDAVDILSAEGV